MGSTGERRDRKRARYIARLARYDLDRFSHEWSRRLQSRCDFIRQKAATGNACSAMETVVSRVILELQACPQEAVDLEGERTIRILHEVCSEAVAETVDARMRRLSNMLEVIKLAELGYREF